MNIYQKGRNSFESEGWLLGQICSYDIVNLFDCGDDDLNEYFREDAAKHKEQLLSKTYFFTKATGEKFPVALADLCNDSVRREKFKESPELKSFCETKHYLSYPAVKITRLGVHKAFQRQNVGTFVINMIKQLFLMDNRTGCRFLTVDAYNRDGIPDFYRRNDFQFFYDQ